MDLYGKATDVRRETLTNCPACGGDITGELEHESLDGYGVSRCQSCEFVFTNPRPIVEDIPKLYEGREAGMDLASQSGVATFLKSIKLNGYCKKLLNISGIAGSFSVLDAGCGDGGIARTFAKMPACERAAGVDFDDRAPAGFEGEKLTYRPYSRMTELGRFDLIVLRHVLEHVPDFNDFLAKLRPMLTERGRLIIEVPDYNSIWRKLFKAHYVQLALPYHISHFTPKTLKQSVKGFRVEKTMGAHVPVLASSLALSVGQRVSNIGAAAAALYPPQLIIDAALQNHTAILAVCSAATDKNAGALGSG